MSAVPLRQAAAELDVDVATVRRWVREGAPTARLGGPGRAQGSEVVVSHLREWRASKARKAAEMADFVALLERILQDYHRAGDHRLVGLRDDLAKALYAALHEYVKGRLIED